MIVFVVKQHQMGSPINRNYYVHEKGWYRAHKSNLVKYNCVNSFIL